LLQLIVSLEEFHAPRVPGKPVGEVVVPLGGVPAVAETRSGRAGGGNEDVKGEERTLVEKAHTQSWGLAGALIVVVAVLVAAALPGRSSIVGTMMILSLPPS
jgi:hypothetical protein